MYVKDHMTKNPYTITKDVVISKAVEIMRKNHFHRLPVVDDQGTGPGHGLIEILQYLQQAGILFPVPEDPGLVLQQAVVLCQGLGVSWPQLGDGAVQEGPPLRRPGLDEGQVLRTEQHRLDYAVQLSGVFALHMVEKELPPVPPEQPGLDEKVPVPALPLRKSTHHA